MKNGNIKYIYRSMGGQNFRIKLERLNDDADGLQVRYTIQEPACLPCNWWQNFLQCFTVTDYDYSYWAPAFCEYTLEERITHSIASLIETWDRERRGEKEWKGLDI